MIIGIGTDLVRISRIEAALARTGDRLAARLLTPAERQKFAAAAHPAAYLAKRFAAKEAAAKALGTGIGKVSWQHLEVSNDSAGAPQLSLSGAAQRLMVSRGGTAVHLSLTDETDLALAFVVISGG